MARCAGSAQTMSTCFINTASILRCRWKTLRARSAIWSNKAKYGFLVFRRPVPPTFAELHAVHPVSALQSEYSLWARNLEPEVIPTLRELGIGLVPYCPLGRGFFAGEVKRAEEYPEGDFRRTDIRYQGQNFDANIQAAKTVRHVARLKQATTGQIALAWLLHKGEDIVPIPGTKRRKYLVENLAAETVRLDDALMKTLDDALAPEKVSGQRYSEWMVNR